MQNNPSEIAYLSASLSNGLQVLLQCEKIDILRKCFLRGRVQKRKYKVTLNEPLGIAYQALYKPECYVARWWWKYFFHSEAQAAVSIHLTVLKTRYKRFKVIKRIVDSLT